eukprot:TRINITY_DN3068_c0_g1::TRINITY_DN3068_c0_g1_i1::g.22311::m.22311 TRINITY_DN3068_c0_g1::TRINITY_DN3068_c0_g1_i1::g.22311  ORF type:complete len:331 (+),score=2.52,sp/Q51876/LEP_PHOLA/35.64/2e-11,Peptidase_S26/PF10502.4/0.0012,Peptidase_S26/PF10502.4/4.1e-06,Peptidase_S24/PF00717.18/8.3e-11,Phage_fiber_2/PF03406.8/0.6 TRINITY_DN3068_c0_g1_i1:49-1041(+)
MLGFSHIPFNTLGASRQNQCLSPNQRERCRSIRPPVFALGQGGGRDQIPPQVNISSILLREFVVPAGCSLLAAGLIRAYLIDNRYITSDSMVPTLEIGDCILAEKISHRRGKLERGDIILFRAPRALLESQERLGIFSRIMPKLFVKRILALSGDHITLAPCSCGFTSLIAVNGSRYLPKSSRRVKKAAKTQLQSSVTSSSSSLSATPQDPSTHTNTSKTQISSSLVPPSLPLPTASSSSGHMESSNANDSGIVPENRRKLISAGLFEDLHVTSCSHHCPKCRNCTTQVVELCIPRNRFFVAGDNTLSSYDSRDFGPIHASQVVGRACVV